MARQHHIPFALLLLAGLTLLVAVTPGGSPAHGAGVTPAGCAELILNGSFEDGESGWQQTSAGGHNLISDFNPRTGSLGAYLAGANNADDRLSQHVVLPAGVSTFHAWWSLATAETGGAFDQMTISLLRPDGSLLADLLTVDNTAPADGWDEIVIELSPYTGQTVVLRFTGRTDDANITDFYLDDVGITACTADPQPTATATQTPPTTTATATLTATPTVTPGVTPTPTLTATPTVTLSVTASRTPTLTATPTASRTPGQGARRIYLPFIIR